MNRIMVSAFDEAFANYGMRMYRSFMRFNKDVPCYYLDFNDMSRVAELEAMRVTILRRPIALPKKRPNFRDMMLWPFVEQVEWDKLLWIDADTLICRPLDPLWLPNVDFVGHPDRDDKGLVLTCGYEAETRRTVPGHAWIKFATGMWVTRNSDFLMECWRRVKKDLHGQRDSDLATHILNTGDYSYYQLNGMLWNFGRNAVPMARYDGEHIYYKEFGKTYHPFAVGFSRVPVNGRDRRLTAPAIEQFYREKVYRERR